MSLETLALIQLQLSTFLKNIWLEAKKQILRKEFVF